MSSKKVQILGTSSNEAIDLKIIWALQKSIQIIFDFFYFDTYLHYGTKSLCNMHIFSPILLRREKLI